MVQLVPVDHDPFADAAAPAGPTLTPVDHDPFKGAAEPGDASAAIGRGIINGVPVVGPYLLDGVNRAAAGVRSLQSGEPFADELARVERFGKTTAETHPYTTTAGEIGGGVVGIAPLVAAAPAAFGAGSSGLVARSLISAASGATLGGADSAVRTGGDLNQMERGAIAGATLGAAAPVAGAGLGAGIRRFYEMIGSRVGPSSGYGPAATRTLAEDVANSGGIAPVRARLDELGPESMLLDASPSLQGQAQGLAIRPETRERVTAPIVARAAGMTDRLAADVNGALGPAVSPQAATDAFAAARRIPNDAIGDAMRGAGPVDTTAVLANLADRLRTAEGPQRTALMQARGMLMAEHPLTGAPIPQANAENLQNVKVTLSGMMDHGAEGLGVPRGSVAQREGALGATVGDLNQALRDQVSGYGSANDVSSALARRMEAIETGSQLLRSGEAATPPADLARRLAGMSQGERDALAIGTRGAIDRAVGTQRNDLAAMRKMLQGEGGWNTANLAQVHGRGPVDRVVGAVNREAAFDAANHNIVLNSQTAQRSQAADRIAPRTTLGDDFGGTVAGAIGGPQGWALAQAGRLAKAGVNAAGQAADIARNRELAQAVTMQPGPLMDQFLDAIGARVAMQQQAAALGNMAGRGTQAALLSQSERVRPYLPAAFPAFPAFSR